MKRTKTILIAGLIAGTLDASAAIVLYAKPLNLHTAVGIFRYIASSLFGKSSFSGGAVYPMAGLIIHFLIAIFWSSVYLLIFLRTFKPGYLWAKTILFSCLVWMSMNGFVLPLFGMTSPHPDPWAILKSFSPILLCVGFPICLIAEKKPGSF